MKNLFLLLILSVGLQTIAFGQDDPLVTKNLTLDVQAASATINEKSATGLQVYVEGSSKDVAKAWKKYLKERYGFKVKNSKGMLTGESVKMSDIWSDNLVDVHSSAKGTGEGSTLSVFVNLGGAFMNANDHQAGTTALEGHLKAFVKQYYTDKLNKVLKKESKAQKKENKALSKLEKTKNKQQKTINKALKKVQKAERSIDKAKKQIRKAEAEMEQMQGEITENEELAKTTEEQQVITEQDIQLQQEKVGGQNAKVKKVLDQLEAVKKL